MKNENYEAETVGWIIRDDYTERILSSSKIHYTYDNVKTLCNRRIPDRNEVSEIDNGACTNKGYCKSCGKVIN